jgi:hypothetical protein
MDWALDAQVHAVSSPLIVEDPTLERIY